MGGFASGRGLSAAAAGPDAYRRAVLARRRQRQPQAGGGGDKGVAQTARPTMRAVASPATQDAKPVRPDGFSLRHQGRTPEWGGQQGSAVSPRRLQAVQDSLEARTPGDADKQPEIRSVTSVPLAHQGRTPEWGGVNPPVPPGPTPGGIRSAMPPIGLQGRPPSLTQADPGLMRQYLQSMLQGGSRIDPSFFNRSTAMGF